MIISLKDGVWTSSQRLTDAFSLMVKEKQVNEVISVVGGGGKTTLLRHLQAECISDRILHAVTTTTHMEYIRNGSFLEEESLESFFRVFEKERTVWLGIPDKKDKMKGVSERFLHMLCDNGVTLLIEADGSRRHPVKIPAGHEPVIGKQSSKVISVYGLAGLHKRICDMGFRKEQLASFLGKKEEDFLEEADYIRLAASAEAGRKHVTEAMDYQVVLSQMDLCEGQETAVEQMAEELALKAACPVHVTGGLKLPYLTGEIR